MIPTSAGSLVKMPSEGVVLPKGTALRIKSSPSTKLAFAWSDTNGANDNLGYVTILKGTGN